MVLKPFFTYYGGKYRAAPHYPAPLYDQIVEPFAGSAGYSLRHPDHQVLLVDKDPVIVSVWRYLLSTSADEIYALPDLYEGTVDDLDVEVGAKRLIGFWLNKGMNGPCRTPSKWMRERTNLNPMSCNFWGPGVRERIASQVDQIRHWRVVEGSYDCIIPTTPPVTWFIDPPYDNLAGQKYRFSSINYVNLGRWCQRLPGQVIVCENEGATWLPFEPFRSIKGTEGPGRTGVSKEVVWVK